MARRGIVVGMFVTVVVRWAKMMQSEVEFVLVEPLEVEQVVALIVIMAEMSEKSVEGNEMEPENSDLGETRMGSDEEIRVFGVNAKGMETGAVMESVMERNGRRRRGSGCRSWTWRTTWRTTGRRTARKE